MTSSPLRQSKQTPGHSSSFFLTTKCLTQIILESPTELERQRKVLTGFRPHIVYNQYYEPYCPPPSADYYRSAPYYWAPPQVVQRTYVDWTDIYPKTEPRPRWTPARVAPRVQTTVRKTKVVKKEWKDRPVTEDPHDTEGNYEEGGTEARSGVKVPESDFEDRLERIFEVKSNQE